MRRAFLLVCCLGVCSGAAAERQWVRGTLRDLQSATANGGSITIPVGGTPPTTVSGVTFAGTAPTYLSFPATVETQYVTIDSPDGLRYVARWNRRLIAVINDPLDFAVEGQQLYVRGLKAGQAHKLTLVKTIRIEQP